MRPNSLLLSIHNHLYISLTFVFASPLTWFLVGIVSLGKWLQISSYSLSISSFPPFGTRKNTRLLARFGSPLWSPLTGTWTTRSSLLGSASCWEIPSSAFRWDTRFTLVQVLRWRFRSASQRSLEL
ncbi:hypothetical protein RchiOBHm_Chr4g0389891 [Rosa chinensis]|uniref:Uncharacterized protein n=1 Tax=Rosa chinensis TaxID=74649 RepID=A0A2P6QQ38_ROSCH|nr:hypothetical protein RchiOBHm_Chr4g0389891 [Rosa chinensis]